LYPSTYTGQIIGNPFKCQMANVKAFM